MAGSKLGGLKAREQNYARHGRDFYRRTGAKGGASTAQDGTIKGFAAMSRKKRQEAGRRGGLTSRKSGSYLLNGMEIFLNTTKTRHNGLGYEDWVAFTTPPAMMSTYDLMELFGVAQATIYTWKRQTELDKKKNKSSVKI